MPATKRLQEPPKTGPQKDAWDKLLESTGTFSTTPSANSFRFDWKAVGKPAGADYERVLVGMKYTDTNVGAVQDVIGYINDAHVARKKKAPVKPGQNGFAASLEIPRISFMTESTDPRSPEKGEIKVTLDAASFVIMRDAALEKRNMLRSI